MQVMNTSPGTITIAGIHHIPAGETRTFENDLWATLRARPAVVQWMAEGKIVEVAAEPAAPKPADGSEASTEAKPEAEPAAPKRGKKASA